MSSAGSTTRPVSSGVPDRRFMDGLVDLEEPARLGPGADGRLDPAPDEHDLAGGVTGSVVATSRGLT